ncbi:ATP-binding cassette domain-containing protein [Mollicutes bacterium LVI A0078]|nr:ATP-binding cassette domain-containing protein [Mollicutes bacterium LVI A0075]WOO91201.1 ATP-binding cassette domain-containing protein [Mollicutes bacterium LVI A0078]
MSKDNILVVEDLKQYFKIPSNEKKTLKEKMFGAKTDLKAVDGVSFNVRRGETFGLVGESGSGKSTIGRSIIKLYDPTGGKITFDGRDITDLDHKGKMKLTNDMQMIFQDPFASVNPRLTIEQIIGEGIKIHQPEKSKEEIKEKVIELLRQVGLNDYHISRYPHEFSGGQLQRVGIARSLAVKPKFIIADESISALDVSIQAQVVNLMKQLQKDFDLTFLFIAHDLSMVKYISDTIGVMYKGKMLELASADEIYANPVHPYTKSLLSAIPHTDPVFEKSRSRITYDGSIHNYVEGDDFRTPKDHQISETHRVFCSDEELAEWTK